MTVKINNKIITILFHRWGTEAQKGKKPAWSHIAGERGLGFMLRLIYLVRLPPPSLSVEGLGWGWVQAMAPVGASTKLLSWMPKQPLPVSSVHSQMGIKKFWKDLIAQKRRFFYTQKSSFSFSVGTAASDCEGVGGDVPEVLLGPNEHKQLGVQTAHSQEMLRCSLGPEALEVTRASLPAQLSSRSPLEVR